jgi:hypothetical protein
MAVMIWGKTLSFREQLALAIFMDRHGLSDLEAAGCVQGFAVACCQVWGHDDQPYAPPEIGGATIAAPEGQRPAHVLCARCGRRASR